MWETEQGWLLSPTQPNHFPALGYGRPSAQAPTMVSQQPGMKLVTGSSSEKATMASN